MISRGFNGIIVTLSKRVTVNDALPYEKISLPTAHSLLLEWAGFMDLASGINRSFFPFRMKKLASGLIDPLVGMCTKEIPLRLDQICG